MKNSANSSKECSRAADWVDLLKDRQIENSCIKLKEPLKICRRIHLFFRLCIHMQEIIKIPFSKHTWLMPSSHEFDNIVNEKKINKTRTKRVGTWSRSFKIQTDIQTLTWCCSVVHLVSWVQKKLRPLIQNKWVKPLRRTGKSNFTWAMERTTQKLASRGRARL